MLNYGICILCLRMIECSLNQTPRGNCQRGVLSCTSASQHAGISGYYLEDIMEDNTIQVIYGEGKGKTSAAIGQSIQAISAGKRVVFIRFLKGKNLNDYTCIERLEPDMKVFCFEKEDELYENLEPDRQEEEKQNMVNGFHFANKVVETGECDLLVLDEVLGLLDIGVLTIQDLYRLIERCGSDVSLIMTGKYVPKELIQHIDIVSEIKQIKQLKS